MNRLKSFPKPIFTKKKVMLSVGKNFYSLSGIQCLPYSPDLAPSDYYLFWSLQNFLDAKTFTQMLKSKTTSISLLPIKTKNFMSVELCYYQKYGERCWIRTVIIYGPTSNIFFSTITYFVNSNT